MILQASADTLSTELAANRHPGITSFHLVRGSTSLAAYTDPGLRSKPPDLRSATKSITALLAGIAIARGHVPSVKSRVAALLPEHRKALESDPRKAAMTVEDLLTMRSGLDCDDWSPGSPGHEDTMYERRDWLAFWAALPSRDAPGTHFSYCTGNVIALGAIIASAAGMPLDRFAREHLFEPLGIRGERWDTWLGGRQVDSGGHLRLQPGHFARIGELVLAQGRWQGRQVVPAGWILRATTAHTEIPGRKQRYGYLWWVDETSLANLPKTRLLMAWGNGGNYLVVMPELRAVAAFTGTRFNQPNALEPLVWLRDRILPGFQATPPAQQ
ncbi:MAG: serine hydrolase [Betaproteobacteria bacterium]|nr:serine hydrolase [Betaproteobacteria bacterium]